MNTPPFANDQPARYSLHLAGRVTAEWRDWLADPVVAYTGDRTTLTGRVCDPAALFGLLNQVRDLNAGLLLVEYLPEINA